MERRDKKARLDSLTELRRLRTEGGSRLDSLKQGREEQGEYYEDMLGPEVRGTEEASGDDTDAFIEDDRQAKRPAVFTFKPRRPTATPADRQMDRTTLAKDDFFQSLISKLDEDMESDEEETKPCMDAGAGRTLPMDAEMEPEIMDAEMETTPRVPPVLDEEHSPSASLGDAIMPMSEGVLSSEWAPHEGQFEIDEATLNQLAIDWSDGVSLDGGDLPERIKVETDKENAPPPTMAVIEAVRVEAPMEETPPLRASSIAVGEPVDFYWIDAFERPNGTIFLFGKILQGASLVSCCVTITNMKRNVFFLPRESHPDTGEEITLREVHEEISAMAASHRIGRFGCKKVLRRYAFEIPGIPMEADYIKMVYGFGEGPALPKDLTGKTFSHVFGTNSSALELFLVKRKIMGPCWLRITPNGTTKRNVSWCKVELEVDNPKAVNPVVNGPEAPPLTVLSMALRTVIEPSSKTHEVVAAAGIVYQRVHVDGNASNGSAERPRCNAVFAVAREREGLGFSAKFAEHFHRVYGSGAGKVELAKNERALLSYLLTMVYRADPDVIVGHNFLGFDLGVLLHRMRACKVDFWSRLGRLNWSQWPKAKPGSTEASYAERQIVAGRLICDTYLSAKDLVKSKNYQLQTLVESQLQQERHPLDYERVDTFVRTADGLAFLLRHCEKDAYFQTALMFQLMVLPLTKQLTNIAGNLWSRTLMGARAERNEYLLLHEFHAQKYLCPDKTSAHENARMTTLGMGEEGGEEDEQQQQQQQQQHQQGLMAIRPGKRKPTYAGGLVLEPKKGLYENYVLLLDFNSLYPSIIQEFNICFTTIERDYSSVEAAERMPAVPGPDSPPGLLPRILASLVARRKQIKSLIKDPKATPGALAQLHIRQQALKLTANSMYGCLGFAHSRFFARPLAMLITGKGREILQSTVDLAQSVCQLEVLYGDTDSVMIHTGTRNLVEARKMGQLLKRTVNERYRLLEIELDGIFERLLLLKKKKYAAIVVEEHADGSLHRRREMKGLDLVRRDWCALSVTTSNLVLEQLLPMTDLTQAADSMVAERVHQILRQVAAQVMADAVPLEQYVISKNLTKEPEQYHDAKSQPHVAVALQMKARGQAVRAGDTIPYVICQTGKTGLAENAFHPDEVRREGAGLVIDKEWYFAQQVHPCVARLCEHLAGTSSAQIAAALGLDSRRYQSSASSINRSTGAEGDMQLTTFLSEEEKYRHVERFLLRCPTCGDEREFVGLLCLVDDRLISGLECRNADPHQHQRHLIPLSALHYQLLAAIRRQISDYHLGWQECDEATCRARTRQPRVYEGRCIQEGCRGSMRPLCPGAQLYRQLQYYLHLVDVERLRSRVAGSAASGTVNWRAVGAEYETVRTMVKRFVDKCAYPVINLAEIFSFISTNKPLSQ